MAKRNVVRTVIAIIGVTLCFAVFCFVGCSGDVDAPAEIYGVSATDVNAVYDGIPHYIQPINVLETDKIYYSTAASGPWRSERISFTMPGEYIVYYKVVRDGCADFISFAKVTIARSVLSGISADNVVCIYDGKPHGISITAVRPTDTVMYSTDGVNFSAACELTDPGEYIVYYRVSDNYGDYFDECSVTVLPDVSGRYLNADGGLISLDNYVAIVNGERRELKYGADGRGTIGGVEFALSDGGITFDGNDYASLSDEDYVYKLSTANHSVYVAASNTAQISIEFDTEQTTAEIKVDSNAVLIEHGVNYCESISSAVLYRRYDSSNVSVEISASSQVTAVNIVNAFREAHSVEFEPIRIVYDGEPHAAVAKTSENSDTVLFLSGEDYVADPPTFTQSGEYTVDVVVLSDGYLPAFAVVTLVILPNINGVYSSATDIVEVDGYSVRRNGYDVACEFSDGAWLIDGEEVSVTETGIVLAEEEFVKHGDDDIVLLFDFNGERTVFINKMDIRVRVHDGIIEVSGEITRNDIAVGEVTVTLNGKTVDGVVCDDETVYFFGVYELNVRVAILRILF